MLSALPTHIVMVEQGQEKHKENSTGKQTCGCQRGRKDWEFGISTGKLLYIGWKNNKVLLYSIGNYIQQPVINHNGKHIQRMYVYV